MTERNPYLPEAPADGHHNFQNGSYRCMSCGVYNRPDVPSTKAVLDQPCKGEYVESWKMRAWAEDRWAEDKAAAKEHVFTVSMNLQDYAYVKGNADWEGKSIEKYLVDKACGRTRKGC
jgi:hypothetical protein